VPRKSSAYEHADEREIVLACHASQFRASNLEPGDHVVVYHLGTGDLFAEGLFSQTLEARGWNLIFVDPIDESAKCLAYLEGETNLKVW